MRTSRAESEQKEPRTGAECSQPKTAMTSMRNAALALTVPEAVANLFKASLGPGCLSLPFALSRAGLAFVPIIICLQAICVYNQHNLVRVKQTLATEIETADVRSYGDISHAVFGAWGRGLVDTFVSLQQLGICTVYFSFASTNLVTLLSDLDGPRPSFTLLVVLLYPLLAGLAQIRHWKNLAPLAIAANALVMTGVAIVLEPRIVLPSCPYTSYACRRGHRARLHRRRARHRRAARRAARGARAVGAHPLRAGAPPLRIGMLTSPSWRS